MSVGDKKSITVELTEGNPRSLYLRTGWADGTTSDGTPFEIAQAGTTVLLSLGNFESGERSVHELRINDLVDAWLAAMGKS